VLWAVRWYCRYGISYRDLEQMMAERGVSVDHSTIYRWVQRYAPEIEQRLRWHWPKALQQSPLYGLLLQLFVSADKLPNLMSAEIGERAQRAGWRGR
jgi:hypothetical protein